MHTKDKKLKAVNKVINQELNLPGSKSIANRVLPLAAFANGTSILHNVPDVGEDVQLMLSALSNLGIEIEKISSAENGCSSYKIYGCGGVIPKQNAELFLGNSGTSIRFLTAMLALSQGRYVLTGIERMKERPIKDLIDALSQVGADVTYLENSGFPPINTQSFVDNNIAEISISGKISSQYLTGILMALPLIKRNIRVLIKDELISRPYVDITIALLKKFGVTIIELETNLFEISSHVNGFSSVEYTVEPDASSASYFLAMASIDGYVKINNLSEDSLQGDKNFAKVLQKMGAKVNYADNYIECQSGKLQAIDINMEDMPDVAMTIAVLATLTDGGVTTISGISSWKVKETDRLLAMYNELTKLGVDVRYTDDSIIIKSAKGDVKQNIAIDTYNDHRMAMCFSLFAVAGNAITINDYHCVGKTFANYFDIYEQILYS